MGDGEEQIGQQTAVGQNTQQAKPTTGPVAPVDIQGKEYAAFKAAQDSDDISKINGLNSLTPESLKSIISGTGLNYPVKIDRKDLTPEAAANPLFNEKDAAGNYLPVYVIPRLGNDKPSAALVTAKNGQRVIFANEGAHQWTEAYVRSSMNSDKEIQSYFPHTPDDFLAKGLSSPPPDAPLIPYTPEQKEKLRFILNSISQYAQNMNLGSYEIRIGSGLPSSAYATTSREGHNYIILDAPTLEKAISSSDSNIQAFLGGIGHEITHCARGDTTPAGIMNHKTALNKRAEEELADLSGAGPLGSHDPESLAEFFEKRLRRQIPLYNTWYPDAQISTDHPSDKDLKKLCLLFHPDHPSFYDRIVALQDEAKRMKQYEATHKVDTLEDRKIESDFVIKQVMKDMQGKWQLPMPVDVEAPAAPLATAPNPGQQKGQTPSGSH